MSQGRNIDGFKLWDKFKNSWSENEESIENCANKDAIHSKIYFSMVQINLNCRCKSSDSFLSIASGILMRVKKISQEFVYHFHHIYYRTTLEAINYSLNRLSDMSFYESVLAAHIATARKKGFCLKLLELLSMSILRNLNMEKIQQSVVRTNFLYFTTLRYVWHKQLI